MTRIKNLASTTDQAQGADHPPELAAAGTDRAAMGGRAERSDEPIERAARVDAAEPPPPPQAEIGGRQGPDPTRYGDWELRGRCIDF